MPVINRQAAEPALVKAKPVQDFLYEGAEHSFGKVNVQQNHRLPKHAMHVQPKLTINQPNDIYEQEADAMADKVMRMPDSAIVQRRCPHCEEKEKVRQKFAVSSIQTKANLGGYVASASINRRIQDMHGVGIPLPYKTRTDMENRFETNFSDVRIHDGREAVELSQELNAQAFTVGNNIFFNQDKYTPNTLEGKQLLAHELTHTLQQRNDNGKRIQRFVKSERSQIANIDAIIRDARTFAMDSKMIGGFAEHTGANSLTSPVKEALSLQPSNKNAMENRYVFTCRCGMIDMQHFYQLMYIAAELSNRAATEAGKFHELNSEDTSRFAPEDSTSNALGAFFGANNFDFLYTSVDKFVAKLSRFLNRCIPVNFKTLPLPEQDAIVKFYSERGIDNKPLHQNETAVPFILNISSCNTKERSFPFALDMGDKERKTINSNAFSNGSTNLTSDSQIRSFINTQRSEIIQNLPVAEKFRLITRLLTGWISNEDVEAVVVICRNSKDRDELNVLQQLVNPLLKNMFDGMQRQTVDNALRGI